MIGVSVRMSVCLYVGMCTKFFFGNHNLEVNSVSQTPLYLVAHSLLGLLQSLITSVTLSLPYNSAVSFNAQARRLAHPI